MGFKVYQLWEALLDRQCLATVVAAEFLKTCNHKESSTALKSPSNLKDQQPETLTW